VGGPLSLAGSRRQQTIALGATGLVVAACGVAPLVGLLADAVGSGREPLAVWSGARPWILLGRSVGLSLVATLVAVIVGVPLGVLIGRTDVHGRRVAAVLHTVSIGLPPFLLALGWFHVFGRQGVLGSEGTAVAFFSELGVLLVLAATFAPIATSLTALALNGIDPSLEEAGRVVASPARVVLRILLPAIAPAIALAAVIIFALSFSELGVPMFLRVETFPAAVFARLGGVAYAPGEAFALVLPLLPVALALLAIERRFVGTRASALVGLRGSDRETMRLGRWRLAATATVWLAAVVSCGPILALAWRAIAGGGFARVGPWLGRAPLNGLAAGIAAATVMTVAGLVAGHALARGLAGSRVLDLAAMVCFLTPAALLGVGIIDVWNRPSLRLVYGSLAILVIGYVARYAAIAMRAIGAVVSQSAMQLEEAAAVAGAGYFRRLTGIVGPLHARGILFAWLLALVFCLRDLETAVLFYPPGRETTTVRLFTLEANGPEAVVAALASVHVAMTATVLAAGAWALGRMRRT
jgi:iron(III) transport system permease protein